VSTVHLGAEARVFPSSLGIEWAGDPAQIGLEVVFELFRQIFDVVWWPVFDVHTQMQAHTGQHFFDFVQRLAAKVWRAQHFGFCLLDQIADVNDVVVLQAVCRTYRQFLFVDLSQHQRVKIQTVVVVVATRRFWFVKVHKDRQLVLQDARCKSGRVIW